MNDPGEIPTKKVLKREPDGDPGQISTEPRRKAKPDFIEVVLVPRESGGRLMESLGAEEQTELEDILRATLKDDAGLRATVERALERNEDG